MREFEYQIKASHKHLTELEEVKKSHSYDINQLESKFDVQITDYLNLAKSTVTALSINQEFQERLKGQSFILQETVKQMKHIMSLETSLKRAKEDIIDTKRTLTQQQKIQKSNVFEMMAQLNE